eukprot:TRINITY_DN16787_c0_g1_i3.p1 TRINITY_DN16787_c0_g1~~TRINITY_DN16787_c0_g1_i3.p1  ORF type:complete len:399 (+),score=64.69 TRINITY_DN16787_c0_g1_i3:66-1262(+)
MAKQQRPFDGADGLPSSSSSQARLLLEKTASGGGSPTSPKSPLSPKSPSSPSRGRKASDRSLRARLLDRAVHHALSDSAKELREMKHQMQLEPGDFRLLDRDGPFGQSKGKWNIARANRQHEYFFRDPFHLLIELSTCRLLCAFWGTYIATYCFFALIFWSVGTSCEIGCETFPQALCLTVETMMTIGYGVPDPYFRKCPWLSLVLMVQCLVAIVYDVCFVGLMYTRISRGTKRASTVLFSQKAVLQTIGADTYLIFRVCEMRRTQLLGAKIRCYCIAHRKQQQTEENGKGTDVAIEEEGGDVEAGGGEGERQSSSPGGLQDKLLRQEPMRLERPDDNLSGEMLLILPTTVVHRIDKFSPLLGPPVDPEDAMGLNSSLYHTKHAGAGVVRASAASVGG